MRIPVSWLREYVDAPPDPAALEHAFVRVGLEVEQILDLRGSVRGPLVVGRVESITELTEFRKPIRHCLVDVGEAQPRSIVCGATNFADGDHVAVILPGGVLPGELVVGSRQTYGHLSDGMICSARELGISDDHSGIIVLSLIDESVELGDDARPLLGLDDIVVELNVTPDRGYCLSVRGLARELSGSLDLPWRDPGLGGVPAPTADPPYPLRVEDPRGCDRFVARLVTGIDPLAASPGWLQRRLALSGVRPISLPVDITNYLMLELGQPMHAFDASRLRGPMVVRRARSGERLTTLDGVDRPLDREDIVITDDSGVISLAAVMGGASTEVGASTTDVLFEAAHWDPIAVARTGRRHKLSSEASRRFERGVDPEMAPQAAARAVALLARYAGGTVDERVLDHNSVAAPPRIVMATNGPSRAAGVQYPAKRVTALLAQVGATVSRAGPGRLAVTPPSWRPDLTDPADLAEEVIRLDGYDNVPSVLPVAPPGGGLTPSQRRRRSLGRALAEAGYVEVLCYPFVSPASFDAMGFGPDDERRRAVSLANPLSAEEPLLRTSLLGPLLGALRRNIGRGTRDVALFEMGLVFHPVADLAADGGNDGAESTHVPSRRASEPTHVSSRLPIDRPPSPELFAAADARLPRQPWHAAAVLAGDVEPAGWWGSGRAAAWADAIEAARIVCATAGLRVHTRSAVRAPWHPGRCAEIVVNVVPDTPVVVVGYAGELHPAVCAALELPKRTAAMELDLDALPMPGPVPAPLVSTYPPALIDVSLIVDAMVPSASVEAALRDGAGGLLEAVKLFDVYAGPQVGNGRKSLAYKLTFRAGDRTLTAEEAVAARDAAVANVADRYGASLRGAQP